MARGCIITHNTFPSDTKKCAVLVRYAGGRVDSKCGVLVVGQDSLADVLGDVQDRREAPECGDYGAG